MRQYGPGAVIGQGQAAQSSEEITSANERTSCLLPLTPVISDTIARWLLSVEELELLAA